MTAQNGLTTARTTIAISSTDGTSLNTRYQRRRASLRPLRKSPSGDSTSVIAISASDQRQLGVQPAGLPSSPGRDQHHRNAEQQRERRADRHDREQALFHRLEALDARPRRWPPRGTRTAGAGRTDLRTRSRRKRCERPSATACGTLCLPGHSLRRLSDCRAWRRLCCNFSRFRKARIRPHGGLSPSMRTGQLVVRYQSPWRRRGLAIVGAARRPAAAVRDVRVGSLRGRLQQVRRDAAAPRAGGADRDARAGEREAARRQSPRPSWRATSTTSPTATSRRISTTCRRRCSSNARS